MPISLQARKAAGRILGGRLLFYLWKAWKALALGSLQVWNLKKNVTQGLLTQENPQKGDNERKGKRVCGEMEAFELSS